MRINPDTGEIITEDNLFCPYCDGDLYDDYPYCDRCNEYVGVVVHDYSGYNQNPQNTMPNNNEPVPLLSKGEKTCCGTICLILFLLWFMGIMSR